MLQKIWSLIVFLLLSASTVSAQPLFNPVEDPVQPHPGLVSLFGGEPSLRTRQTTLDAQYFASRINAPSGELVINLFPDFVVRSTRRVVTAEGEGSYTWRGTVEGAKFHGDVVLAVVGHQIAGTVQKDGRTFLIRPISDDRQVVSEVNQAAFPKEGEPLVPYAGNARFQVQSLSDRPKRVAPAVVGGAYTITVMLVYPAGNWMACGGGPFGWLSPLVPLVYESNLNNVWDTFTTDTITADVSIYCSSYVPAGGDMLADIAWVESDPAVAAERDARLADVVSLQVVSATNCGLGYAIEPLPDAGDDIYGFSVVRGDCSISNFSLAHEIGHNHGLDHDRYVESDGLTSTGCNFGYVFTLNGAPVVRDVMAYEDSCTDAGLTCPRVAAYSYDLTLSNGVNTAVFGKPCADPDAASNVTQFQSAVPIVSLWR